MKFARRLDQVPPYLFAELEPTTKAHPGRIRARIFERGAGETLSSGTSSVAAAAAGVARGWCESPVTVHLVGGDLQVELADGRAVLTGPAEEICLIELAPEFEL